MHDFQFQFDHGAEKEVKPVSNLETWVPLEDNPELNSKEKEAVLFGNAVDSLYIVKPAFLVINERSELDYVEAKELDYYYVVAKLKKSPYMVLLGEEKSSKVMQKHMNERNAQFKEKTFYLDLYFSPNFGGLKPRNYLFEQVKLNAIPNAMVLFKENDG